MKTIVPFFKKTILVALIAVLALATLPVTSAYASGLSDPTTCLPMAHSFRMNVWNVSGPVCCESTNARERCSTVPTGWPKDSRT